MRTLTFWLFTLPIAVFGAFGDKAPSIPSTYVASHPRLGAPTTPWLNALYATGTGPGTPYSVRKVVADAWSNSTGRLDECRDTLEVYLADKLNNGPNHAAWLGKVKSMYQSGSYHCRAIAYDWAYNDLDAADRANYLTALDQCSDSFEANWNGNTSPYNDVGYINGYAAFMWCAAAQYPDAGATGLAHLRYATDVLLNVMMPVWRQQFSRNGKGTTGSDPDNGGAWTEGWNDYVHSVTGNGMNIWIMPNLLAWANASGRGMPFFTTDHPWIRNYAYWTPYMVRPDWTVHRIGQVKWGIFDAEYNVVRSNGYIPRLGSVACIASVYDDTDLRGWVRQTNWYGATPNGFESDCYPWFTPDSASKTATPNRSAMAKVKNFPGSGTTYFKTGFGENDVSVVFRWGPGYWSHPTFDAGHIEAYKNGALTLTSGSYIAGAMCEHQGLYKAQTIAHNAPLILDPADVYTDETYDTCPGPDTHIPNDGGQRRTGSNYANQGGLANAMQAPADLAGWMRAHHYYDTGTQVAFAVGSGGKYAYAAADITAAYNNYFSAWAHTGVRQPFEANTVNRSYRVRKAVRHFIWIPRGTSAYVAVYDQIISTQANFKKTVPWHTVNQPTLGSYTGGKSYVITRGETVTATSSPCSSWAQWASNLSADSGNCGSGFTYNYDGKMYGFAPDFPGATVVTQTNVGGTGNEFKIGSTNYDNCGGPDLCPQNVMGANDAGKLTPVSNVHGTIEPGAWRLEQSPSSAALEDWFLNVQLLTTTGESNVVSTEPLITSAGTNCVEGSGCNWEVEWQDNSDGCTYTLALPKRGVGGAIEITGAGCTATVNEGLVSQQSGVDVAVGQWVKMDDNADVGGYYEPLNPLICGYDATPGWVPSLGMTTLYANWRSTSCEPQQTLIGYDPAENRVNILDDGGVFGGPHINVAQHPNGWSAVDPATNVMFGTVGNSGGRGPALRQVDYWYDFNALAGREKQGTPGQGVVSGVNAVTAFDPLRRKLVRQGGASFSGFGDYDPSTASWSKGVACTADSADCPSPQSLYANLAYRDVDQLLWMFSDQGVHKYNTATRTSTQVVVSTCTPACPIGRFGSGFVYIPEDDKFFMASGSSRFTLTADHTTNTFTSPVSHGMHNGMLVSLNGTTCPAGISCNYFFVVNSAGTTFQLASTQGGMAIDFSDNGTGLYLDAYYQDTWVLDPAVPSWTRLHQNTYPAGPTISGQHNRFTYVPRWQLVVGWDGDNSNQTARPLWIYRYRSGSKLGWLSGIYASSPGSLNRNTDSWAHRPSIASSGADVYVMHTETGGKMTTDKSKFFYPYAHKLAGATRTNLGGTYSSFGLQDAGAGDQWDGVSIAIVNGSPWACGSSIGYNLDYAGMVINLLRWDGNSWGSIGRMAKVGSTGGQTRMAQMHCSLADVGGIPTFAFAEASNNVMADLRVYRHNGTSFVAVGSALNMAGADASYVDSLSLVSNGTNPVVAWSEYKPNDIATAGNNVPQIYAKLWDGDSWEPMCGGAAANVTGWRRAQHVSATWLGSTLYVAFVERAAEGGNGGHALLYVRSCPGTGGTWATVGSGDLNRDTYNGWVYAPKITNDGTDLFIAWAESGNSAPWLTNVAWNLALAQKPQIHAAKLTTAGALTYLGGSLNADTVNGSAQYPVVAMRQGNPIVAWREHKLGTQAQIYLKQWNGTDWVALSDAPAGGSSVTTWHSFGAVTSGAKTGQ
jgi:hypothetical protein